jgi:CRP/FNR family cyclic AMP-dependent transcriptional regulator
VTKITKFKSFQPTMFEQINKNVTRYHTFSKEDLSIFNSLLKPLSVKKKTHLLQAGEVCNFEGFINKGCIMTYLLNEEGKETVLYFSVEDWWVSDMCSFNEQSKSEFYIQAMEDCELLILTPETKEELLFKVPKFERVFRLMIQKNLGVLQNRFHSTIAKPAEKRYDDFLKRYPNIPQRVSQLHIASYLGVTPEFLSKIRAKKAHS